MDETDYAQWILTPADSKAFVEHLLNPPEPNEALKAAAERYKRRVRDSGCIEVTSRPKP